MSGGEGEEAGVDGLHTQAAHRSQCDAEEWNAVAGGGESAGLILRQLLRLAPRTDANIILQDVTHSAHRNSVWLSPRYGRAYSGRSHSCAEHGHR